MTDNVKVAISSDFLTAFARLPRQVQGKVTEFVNKFRNNPMSPGINYEKLNSGIDKKIFSGGAPYGVMWEEVGIDPGLPFEEKVKLYHMQMLG